MGLRNAAAHFQQCMAVEVLNGLVNVDCELYLDDVLVHARSEDQFLERLRKILDRFEKRGLVLSPSKCSFGMSEVEILGHTINSEGSHFSREKLDTVLEFKLPATGTQMQSFLGLCNYYRRHVKDIAQLEQPLRNIITRFPGTRQIPWINEQEALKAFHQLREAVGSCPRLFFYDNRMPVYVHTDACNGGIGGYLFQLGEDGTEYPIGFLSKALHGAELKWSTFEQECYAIHQTIKKFSYLLRDVKFIIKTDHRNLLYLNNEASPKVLRWKWDIQQYNFDVLHIAGEHNVAADLFSRLCGINPTDRGDINRQSHVDSLSDSDFNAALEAAHAPILKGSAGPSLLALAATRRVGPLRPWMKNNRPLDQEVHRLISQVHGWGRRHDDGSSTTGCHGHGGVERTLRLLKDSVLPSKWWYTMRKDVRQFINECPQCQFMEAAKLHINKSTIHPFNMAVGAPMERINIDTIGPFPEDDQGNKHICVLIDVFSRFVELYPIPDLTAVTAARKIVEFVGRYGHPSQVLTDNGKQYVNDLSNELYDLMLVDHLTVMPYSHEENSIVERANKEVNRHLRAIVFDRKIKTNWSLVLPLVQRVLNTTVHSSTGVAPAQIIFGSAINLDRHVLHKNPPASEPVEYSEYVTKLLNVQAEVVARALTIQEIVTQKHVAKQLHELRPVAGFNQNDYVLWEYPESGLRKDSRPDRLTPHYRGPYRVIESVDSKVSIQNLITEEQHEVIVSQLKPFRFDPNIVNPVQVAHHAQQEFLPERILQIDGDRSARSRRYLRTGLTVKVRWTGYSEQWDTWEPYQELKYTAAFKAYCEKNRLNYLLDTHKK